MSGIIKPRVVNSLLINNELGQNFITHYSSAPIYGKYGTESYSMPTHLPINFSINGKSSNILQYPSFVINRLKFRFIIGDIDLQLYNYISKIILDNPQLFDEITGDDKLDQLIILLKFGEDNEFNSNSSLDVTLDEDDIPFLNIIESQDQSLSTEDDEDDQFENYLINEIAKITNRSNKINY